MWDKNCQQEHKQLFRQLEACPQRGPRDLPVPEQRKGGIRSPAVNRDITDAVEASSAYSRETSLEGGSEAKSSCDKGVDKSSSRRKRTRDGTELVQLVVAVVA